MRPLGPTARWCIWALAALTLAGEVRGAELSFVPGRASLDGVFESRFVVPVESGSPRQLPAGFLSLLFTYSLRPGLRAVVATRAQVGGTVQENGGFDVLDISTTFEDPSPSLDIEEAYLDLSHGDVDLRIGKQKIVWGRLDTFSPNDVVSPRRYFDPFLDDARAAKIGIPAVLGTWSPPTPIAAIEEPALTAIWVPVPVSVQFPEADERWFPPASDIQSMLRFPGRPAIGLPPTSVENDFQTRNRPPPQQLDEGAVALRLGARTAGVDWALYGYNGPETNVAFNLDFSGVAPEARKQLAAGGTPTLADLSPLNVRSVLSPRFGRIGLFGADAASVFGNVATRIEFAWSTNRLLPRPAESLLAPDVIDRFFRRDGVAVANRLLAGRRARIRLGQLFEPHTLVEWGVGADYPMHGVVAIAEVHQTLVADYHRRLLLSRADTQVILGLRKTFMNQRLQTEVSAVQGVVRSYTAGIARASYALTDTWRATLGYLFLAGTRVSLIGEFHDNDEVFAELRYSF